MTAGVLLDPRTGRPDGDPVVVPPSGEVEAWRRRIAERDTRRLLDRAAERPGIQATTTTNRYLCIPAAAAGVGITAGAGVWTFSAYSQLAAANAITATFYLVGVCFQPPAASATATTNEYLLELATGAASSEVLAVQLPFTVRNVTAAGYIPPAWLAVPEPKQVAANTRVAARLAASVASLAITGLKLIYETA
jgi:hypothetical protein